MGIFAIIDRKLLQVAWAGQRIIFPISCDGANAAPIIQMNGYMKDPAAISKDEYKRIFRMDSCARMSAFSFDHFFL
jgi:hypothetical protein